MTYFERCIFSLQSPGGTEEKHKAGQPASGSRNEPDTSHIQRSASHYTATFNNTNLFDIRLALFAMKRLNRQEDTQSLWHANHSRIQTEQIKCSLYFRLHHYP
jgi:hypothetical protein